MKDYQAQGSLMNRTQLGEIVSLHIQHETAVSNQEFFLV